MVYMYILNDSPKVECKKLSFRRDREKKGVVICKQSLIFDYYK